MDATTVVSNYAKTLLAMLTGDQDLALATYNERKASAAIDRNISNLKTQLVDDECVLQEAQEALKEAKYPKYKISQGHDYCGNLLNYKEKVEKAQDRIDSTKVSIEYFEELKKELFG